MIAGGPRQDALRVHRFKVSDDAAVLRAPCFQPATPARPFANGTRCTAPLPADIAWATKV
jgi:hypothetical protein